MKKTAWFTIGEPTLNFLSYDQFTSSAFGSEKLTSWVWEEIRTKQRTFKLSQ